MNSTTPFVRLSIQKLIDDRCIIAHADGNHGERHPTSADYVATGVPFLMASDILNFQLSKEGVKFISESRARQLRTGFAQDGDVLLTHKGTVGETCVLRRQFDCPFYMLTPQVTLFRVDPDRLSPRFLQYAFASQDFQSQLRNFSAQSTRPFVSLTTQRFLSLSLPSLPIQRAIAAVLGAYDDLIENNARRIRVLEEMARTLYREWIEERSLDGDVGWKTRRLRDIAVVNARTIRAASAPARMQYVDIASVSRGAVNALTPYKFADAPGRARRLVTNNDIIWSQVRPNHRAHALLIDPPADMVVSTGFAVISPSVAPSLLYAMLTTDSFVDYLMGRARGAAYPAVGAEDFEVAELNWPPPSTAQAFEVQAACMYRLAHTLRQKNRTLRETRDLLLPRLMSGEIELRAAERAAP